VTGAWLVGNHLEINVGPDAGGVWQAVLTPVHAFPLMDAEGRVTGWERRDVVTIVESAK
jgi:hypothetical protein